VGDARHFVAQRLRDRGLDRHLDVVRVVVSGLATKAGVHSEHDGKTVWATLDLR
jgi:hypothetical protein